jgi:hypothetical protein
MTQPERQTLTDDNHGQECQEGTCQWQRNLECPLFTRAHRAVRHFRFHFGISGYLAIWDRDRLTQQVISVCLDAAALALSLPGALSSAIASTYTQRCCNCHLMAWTTPTPKLGAGLGRLGN